MVFSALSQTFCRRLQTFHPSMQPCGSQTDRVWPSARSKAHSPKRVLFSVMENQTVAQDKPPTQSIGGNFVPRRHLRAWYEILIKAIKLVTGHIGMDQTNDRDRPYRVHAIKLVYGTNFRVRLAAWLPIAWPCARRGTRAAAAPSNGSLKAARRPIGDLFENIPWFPCLFIGRIWQCPALPWYHPWMRSRSLMTFKKIQQ